MSIAVIGTYPAHAHDRLPLGVVECEQAVPGAGEQQSLVDVVHIGVGIRGENIGKNNGFVFRVDAKDLTRWRIGGKHPSAAAFRHKYWIVEKLDMLSDAGFAASLQNAVGNSRAVGYQTKVAEADFRVRRAKDIKPAHHAVAAMHAKYFGYRLTLAHPFVEARESFPVLCSENGFSTGGILQQSGDDVLHSRNGRV